MVRIGAAAGLALVAGAPATLPALAAAPAAPAASRAATRDPVTVHVFHDNDLHFAAGDSSRYDTDFVTGHDNGRRITRTVTLPRFDAPLRIVAQLAVRPIPKDAQSVWDKWDRAGNVRLQRPGHPDIELVKFITAYGGPSRYRVDVTHLAPLLAGRCTFAGFIDTWVTPAWKMDFSLVFEPAAGGAPVASSGAAPAPWVESLFYEENLTAERMREGPVRAAVEIPEGLARVVLHYLVSGHCTDGRDADEFASKDNVILVDGREVHRFQPWRDDCLRFRTVNPYTRRWSDGTWSSDYGRSGWCPGDRVEPLALDLSEQLEAGAHTIALSIEGIRPRGDDGHRGYWRASAYLAGWRDE